MTGSAVWRAPECWRDVVGPRPLVMVTTSYPGVSTDVAGRFIQTMARQLIARGHSVTIVAPAGPSARRPRVYWVDGVEIRWVAFPGWRRGPFHVDGLPETYEARDFRALASALSAVAPLLSAVVAELRRHGPRSVVVGHWLVPGGAIAQLASHLVPGTLATTICHSGALRLVARAPAAVARPIIGASVGSGTCVTTATDLAKILEETGGIDPDHIVIEPMPAEPARRWGQPPTAPPFRILTMGRLVPIKGIGPLLESLVGVPGVELHIAGDGPLRPDLEELAARLPIEVCFHGVVVGEAKERLLSSCHGFVLASQVGRGGRTEGSPVSVREALNYNLPVLATPVGGLVDLAASDPRVRLVHDHDLASAWPGFLRTVAARWSLTYDDH